VSWWRRLDPGRIAILAVLVLGVAAFLTRSQWLGTVETAVEVAVDAVDGIVARIRESWQPENLLVVATGGFAPVIGPHAASVERVEPFLTLQGLGIAGAYLAGEG